jgi:hypothetical protein
MDGLITTLVGLLKVAAVVASSLVSFWALLMYGYSNPMLLFGLVIRNLWGLGALVATLGLGIGLSASLVARRMGESAWALVPALWVAASLAILVFGPQSSAGS